MNKVVTVNLNGNAYQLEEGGYNELLDYLKRAEAKLQGVDKREVIADLEQSIADKCASYLRPHKSVVSADEVAEILKAIGPVQDADSQSTTDNRSAEETRPRPERYANNLPYRRRLYRLQEGAMLAGVCAGLGAFTRFDVRAVRVLFVIAVLATWGIGVFLYVVWIFIVPVARTEEEVAAAHGRPLEMRGH